MKYQKYLISYLIIVNLIAFISCYIDKKRAIKNKYRLKESYLLTLSFLGGALGLYISMYLFRHKTKKIKFTLIIPLIIILWIIILSKVM